MTDGGKLRRGELGGEHYLAGAYLKTRGWHVDCNRNTNPDSFGATSTYLINHSLQRSRNKPCAQNSFFPIISYTSNINDDDDTIIREIDFMYKARWLQVVGIYVMTKSRNIETIESQLAKSTLSNKDLGQRGKKHRSCIIWASIYVGGEQVR